MTPHQTRLPWWSRAISAVLLIALAYLLGYWLSKWFAPKPLAAPAAALAPALELSGAASKAAAESLGLLFSKPTVPLQEASAPEIKLHGVVLAGPDSSILASIASEKPRVYRVGESIGDFRIRSVQDEAALLESRDGRSLRIELAKRENLIR